MRRILILSLALTALFASAFTTESRSAPKEETITMQVNGDFFAFPSVNQVQVFTMDESALPCVCTQAFKRWPWENTYWRQCYNTGGDHDIWAEAGDCAQSSCFPSQCGATP